MSVPWLPWVVTALSLLAGCWVQTAMGFGMAIVAAPIIVLVAPQWVPVVLTVTALSVSAINCWNVRAHLDWRRMTVPMLTRLPGTALGTWLLLQLDHTQLQFLVAACVVSAVALSYYAPRFEATPVRLGWAGFASGVAGTTTAIGGPPMVLLLQHAPANTVRANLSLYFSYSCIVSLIGYAVAGLLSRALVLHSMAFLPCALLGFYLGRRARAYVDAGRFRPLLLGLCGVSGVMALVGALYRLFEQ